MMKRRDALALAVAGMGSTIASGEQRAASRSRGSLDLSTPAAQLVAFAKMFVSTRAETVWYWYSGVLNAAIPGKTIVALAGCDTLIRRNVLPQADGRIGVRTFEANFFRHANGTEAIERMTNPVTGREVQPFHYREGPHVLLLSERHAPRFVAGTEVPPLPSEPGVGALPPPFSMPWQRSGPVVWTTRETYADRSHPLDPTIWKLESSGPRLAFGSFASYFSPAAQLASPRVARADCDFTYQAIAAWWPWLLMGQTPGHMIWRAQGRKPDSLDETPAASRAGFERVRVSEYPQWRVDARQLVDRDEPP